MSHNENSKIYDNFQEEKDREEYLEKKYSKKPFNFLTETDEFIFNAIKNLK